MNALPTGDGRPAAREASTQVWRASSRPGSPAAPRGSRRSARRSASPSMIECTPSAAAISWARATAPADSSWQISRGSGPQEAVAARAVATSAADSTFATRTAATWPACTSGVSAAMSAAKSSVRDRVDADDDDRRPVVRRQRLGEVLARGGPLPRVHGVLEVDDDAVGDLRGLGQQLPGAGRRDVEPGERPRPAAASLRPPRSRAASRSSSASTPSSRAPRRCRRRAPRPVWRIRPGCSERRNITFGIRIGPRSSSSTVAIAPMALYCSSTITRLMSLTTATAASAFSNSATTTAVALAQDPGADGLVEDVGVLGALVAVAEPRLVGQVVTTDQAHHPLGDRLGAGGDRDPVAVGGLVGVARGVVLRAVAGALGDDRRAGRRR